MVAGNGKNYTTRFEVQHQFEKTGYANVQTQLS
jgi:hypothetical protein